MRDRTYGGVRGRGREAPPTRSPLAESRRRRTTERGDEMAEGKDLHPKIHS